MGRKADRQAAARLMWAAEKIISDAASLTPYGDDGEMRNRVHDMANDVRLLAGDVYWGRE